MFYGMNFAETKYDNSRFDNRCENIGELAKAKANIVCCQEHKCGKAAAGAVSADGENHVQAAVAEKIRSAKRIVVKVGTSSLVHCNGKLNFRSFDLLARQLADLHNCGKQVDDNVLICPDCGALVRRYGKPAPQQEEPVADLTYAAETAEARPAKPRRFQTGAKVWLILCIIAAAFQTLSFFNLFYLYGNRQNLGIVRQDGDSFVMP